MENKGLFLRQATGLVRTIGTKEAFLINIAVLSPGLGFIYMTWALSFGVNADLTWSFLIAGVTALFLALCYSQLVASMPRTGGDYVFTSRLLHPVIGSAVGGAGILIYLTVVGTNSAIFSGDFMASFFNELGLIRFGTFLTQPWVTFLFGVLLILVCGYVTSLGTRKASLVMWICFILGMIGFLAVVIVFLSNSNQNFIATFNSLWGDGAYNSLIDTAKANGFSPGISFFSTLLAVPLCAMVYWGFTSANYPAGELKSAGKTLRRSTIITLISGFLLMVAIWEALKRTVGLHFLQSVTFLSNNFPDAYSGIADAPTALSYYATILSSSQFVRLLIAFSFMAWVVVFVLAYYTVISRITFAMSFDRVLPDSIANTSKNNTPVNAIIATAIGMTVLLALQVFYSGLLAGVFNATLALAIVYLLVSVSVTILPFTKRELFEASPKVIKWKLGKVPGISIIGGISTLFLAFIIYLCIVQPQVIGPLSIQAIVFTIFMFGWGVVAYFIQKSRFKKQTGLDLAEANKEIPPE